MKILLVEDEEFIAENICQYLRKLKTVQIQYVTRCRDALKMLRQYSFDLLLSDLRLPDATDMTWLTEVGKINPGQRVMIISAYSVPELLRRTSTLNIICYFEKPFDIQEVMKQILNMQTSTESNLSNI